MDTNARGFALCSCPAGTCSVPRRRPRSSARSFALVRRPARGWSTRTKSSQPTPYGVAKLGDREVDPGRPVRGEFDRLLITPSSISTYAFARGPASRRGRPRGARCRLFADRGHGRGWSGTVAQADGGGAFSCWRKSFGRATRRGANGGRARAPAWRGAARRPRRPSDRDDEDDQHLDQRSRPAAVPRRPLPLLVLASSMALPVIRRRGRSWSRRLWCRRSGRGRPR
jgi:hypothetical protein